MEPRCWSALQVKNHFSVLSGDTHRKTPAIHKATVFIDQSFKKTIEKPGACYPFSGDPR